MPMGTLMKKTQRHPGPSVNRPLAMTPIDADVPATAPKMPSARLRSTPSAKVTARIDRAAGRHQRGAEALHGAGTDDDAGRVSEPSHERCAGEEDETAHEDAAAPEQIGHASAEQQEAAEQQGVADHDPLERPLREIELLLDRGEGDVHDRDVEHDHELDEAGERQDHAFVRTGDVHEGLPGDRSRSGLHV